MDSITLSFVLSVISAVISGAFAVIVLRRWSEKRRPYYLAWGIGLALYFVGTFSQVVLALTWSPVFFGLWYWSGAILVAPWLGQGTIFLLVQRGNSARNLHVALIAVTLITLPWVLFLTDFNDAAWVKGADMTEIYRDHEDANGEMISGVMPGGTFDSVRIFSPIMNTWGTIALVGGAIYSAWILRKKQILSNRVYGNWLIAIGGLLPAMGGVLLRLGDPSFKYLGEMGGAVLIFIGFLVTTHVPSEAPSPEPQAAGD